MCSSSRCTATKLIMSCRSEKHCSAHRNVWIIGQLAFASFLHPSHPFLYPSHPRYHSFRPRHINLRQNSSRRRTQQLVSTEQRSRHREPAFQARPRSRWTTNALYQRNACQHLSAPSFSKIDAKCKTRCDCWFDERPTFALESEQGRSELREISAIR